MRWDAIQVCYLYDKLEYLAKVCYSYDGDMTALCKQFAEYGNGVEDDCLIKEYKCYVCSKLISYTYDAWGNFTTTYSNGGSIAFVIYNSFREGIILS